MLTIVLFIVEVILLVNLAFLMRKLKKKNMIQELNIAVSALALVGIIIVITFILGSLSGY